MALQLALALSASEYTASEYTASEYTASEYTASEYAASEYTASEYTARGAAIGSSKGTGSREQAADVDVLTIIERRLEAQRAQWQQGTGGGQRAAGSRQQAAGSRQQAEEAHPREQRPFVSAEELWGGERLHVRSHTYLHSSMDNTHMYAYDTYVYWHAHAHVIHVLERSGAFAR